MTPRTNRLASPPFTSLGQLKHVHLMGICGTGMSALAGMFHSYGINVTGSDQAAYPPASLVLNDLGIEVRMGYAAENLHPEPDLVVVGNVIRRDYPEAVEMERLGIPYASLPECLNQFFLRDKRLIVVTGTHGKTTVSSMLAWILLRGGYDPGFLIGGVHGNLGTNYRIGAGEYFVLEGDEYDTAYFDKRPKFLHYRPSIGIITSCEFDHADIYNDLSEIEEQFRQFTKIILDSGWLIACTEYPNLIGIIENCSRSTLTYGSSNGSEWKIRHLRNCPKGIEVSLEKHSSKAADGTVPIMGLHNALNALAAVAAADLVGLPPPISLELLGTYRTVARRQQILLSKSSVIVIDDFAHHPTAVRETIKAVRLRYGNKRIIAVFEPRSNTSRTSMFQESYADSFTDADMAIIKEPAFRNSDPIDNRFSSRRLAADLTARGVSALAFQTTDSILEFLLNNINPHDVVLVMSNGYFDNLAARLVEALEEERVERSPSLRKT